MRLVIRSCIALILCGACVHSSAEDPTAKVERGYILVPADPIRCESLPEAVEALLQRLRQQVSQSCVVLNVSAASFSRLLCPEIGVQLVVASSAESCLRSAQEPLAEYRTIAYSELTTLKPPTPEQLSLHKMRLLRGPLALLRFHTGAFPTKERGLQALQSDPEAGMGHWQGPYVSDSAALQDSWGGAISYESYENGRRYRLISAGQDQKFGTQDDLKFEPYR